MDSYQIGNLFGRLAMSGAMVYIVLLISNRGSFKQAWKQWMRPLSIGATVFLFIIGLVGHANAETQSVAQEPVTNTAKERLFKQVPIAQAGLSIHLPSNPLWQWQTQRRAANHSVILFTPDNYFPPASLEMTIIPNMQLNKMLLRSIARSSIDTVRRGLGVAPLSVDDKLQKISYGNISGYQHDFDFTQGGTQWSARNFLGLLPSGKALNFFLYTPPGKLLNIEPVIDKIVANTFELSPI